MAMDQGLLSLPTEVVPQRPELLAPRAAVVSRGHEVRGPRVQSHGGFKEALQVLCGVLPHVGDGHSCSGTRPLAEYPSAELTRDCLPSCHSMVRAGKSTCILSAPWRPRETHSPCFWDLFSAQEKTSVSRGFPRVLDEVFCLWFRRSHRTCSWAERWGLEPGLEIEPESQEASLARTVTLTTAGASNKRHRQPCSGTCSTHCTHSDHVLHSYSRKPPVTLASRGGRALGWWGRRASFSRSWKKLL